MENNLSVPAPIDLRTALGPDLPDVLDGTAALAAADAVLLAAMPMPCAYPVRVQRHGDEPVCVATRRVTTVLSPFTISASVGAIPAHGEGGR